MFRRASTAASSPEAGPTQHDSQTGAATKPVREVQAAGKFARYPTVCKCKLRKTIQKQKMKNLSDWQNSLKAAGLQLLRKLRFSIHNVFVKKN